jgi:hypothetical protein
MDMHDSSYCGVQKKIAGGPKIPYTYRGICGRSIPALSYFFPREMIYQPKTTLTLKKATLATNPDTAEELQNYTHLSDDTNSCQALETNALDEE